MVIHSNCLLAQLNHSWELKLFFTNILLIFPFSINDTGLQNAIVCYFSTVMDVA